MSELITLIQNANDFCAIGAAEFREIEIAEKNLGVSFADDYMEYVLAFGAASFCSRELTGICKSERLNVLSATNRARQYYHDFPKNMYVIEELLFDHIVMIQNCEGMVFSYGPSEKVEEVAGSLRAYLFPEE